MYIFYDVICYLKKNKKKRQGEAEELKHSSPKWKDEMKML